jgi:hypothetical protein
MDEERSTEDNKSDREDSSGGRHCVYYKTFESEGSQAVLIRPFGKGDLEIR